MESLPHDVLVKIVEDVENEDVRFLRLVNKGFNLAVPDAAILLRPSFAITDSQFVVLCASFPVATSLDISHCNALTRGTLATLGQLEALSEHLRHLDMSDCLWLTDRDSSSNSNASSNESGVKFRDVLFSECFPNLAEVVHNSDVAGEYYWGHGEAAHPGPWELWLFGWGSS